MTFTPESTLNCYGRPTTIWKRMQQSWGTKKLSSVDNFIAQLIIEAIGTNGYRPLSAYIVYRRMLQTSNLFHSCEAQIAAGIINVPWSSATTLQRRRPYTTRNYTWHSLKRSAKYVWNWHWPKEKETEKHKKIVDRSPWQPTLYQKERPPSLIKKIPSRCPRPFP